MWIKLAYRKILRYTNKNRRLVQVKYKWINETKGSKYNIYYRKYQIAMGYHLDSPMLIAS